MINETYVGGQVRQYGNYSFSRVYQAGHMVPSYQPETSYKIFMRAMFNKDIATGTLDLTDSLKTKGPLSTWHIKNEVFPAPEPECYILAHDTCTEEEYELVKNNTAIIKDYILVGRVDEKAEKDAASLGSPFPHYAAVDRAAQRVLDGGN